MILAGDVGGTKTRLALFDPKKKNFEPLFLKIYKSKEHPDLLPIIRDFLSNSPVSKIETACFACPGSVYSGEVAPTNLPWKVSAKEISQSLNIKNVSLINDLEACGYAIKILPKESLLEIHAGEKRKGNKAILSPGTGLGEACLYWDGKEHHPFASEGGHSSFAPQNDEEIELWRFLHSLFGSVSYERILSGPGLVNVYNFLRDNKKEAFLEGSPDLAASIAKAGLEKSSIFCEKALSMFVSILGAEASNLTLKVLAYGGIYLGGGIPPKILPKIKEKSFYASFLNKGRMRSLLEKIPIYVILDEYAALKGSAAHMLLEKK